jgi:hypothetical protein
MLQYNRDDDDNNKTIPSEYNTLSSIGVYFKIFQSNDILRAFGTFATCCSFRRQNIISINDIGIDISKVSKN